jgi:hypothetical protein
MNEEILRINVEKKFPIPGMAMTQDPDNPSPSDKPPEFTDIHDCIKHIFLNSIQEENYMNLMELLAKGFPLMEIVQTVLFQGFYGGKWNYSMMLLLIEPVAYIFLAFAERAGIDPVFFRDDIDQELEEEEILGVSFDKAKLQQIQSDVEQDKKVHPAITDQMLAQIDNIPEEQIGSLLDSKQVSQEDAIAPPAEGSLLDMQGEI